MHVLCSYVQCSFFIAVFTPRAQKRVRQRAPCTLPSEKHSLLSYTKGRSRSWSLKSVSLHASSVWRLWVSRKASTFFGILLYLVCGPIHRRGRTAGWWYNEVLFSPVMAHINKGPWFVIFNLQWWESLRLFSPVKGGLATQQFRVILCVFCNIHLVLANTNRNFFIIIMFYNCFNWF